MEKRLLSGNEAIARAAYEAGVTVASGYPGTPSTEILENISRHYRPDIYCEWSPNEKVALEVAAGAALSGARCLVTMKHVGLNVAADPLMTLSYTGVEGGLVICVADDPGMHSSQNEQDSRNYARFAKLPLLEPSDSQEARDFVIAALDLSEKYRVPVLLRTTTRISHSRSPVQCAERKESKKKKGFVKNPCRYVTVPLWARQMRQAMENRVHALLAEQSHSPLNRIEQRDPGLGIITSSISYQYVREVWPDASVLKLGFAYPFPDLIIEKFAEQVKSILVVEELDDIVEQHVRSLGIKCKGREYVPGIGELSVTRLRQSRAMMEKKPLFSCPEAVEERDLPARPPVLCPGCPHRGIFYSLGKHDVVVTGDIGCYSLGAFKPLERLDTIVCMGAGISMAHGMDKAGEPKKVVGIVGDSTFFHSGMTGLLDIAYNKGRSTIIVLDNRTTAMTGHQEHPGTGRTLMGESTNAVSIAGIGKACGIRRTREIDPYDLKNTGQVIKEELEADEPSLIVSRAPCVLLNKKSLGKKRIIDAEKCKKCRQCLKLGCPAIEAGEEEIKINELLCTGCGLCQQVCPFQAIEEKEKDE